MRPLQLEFDAWTMETLHCRHKSSLENPPTHSPLCGLPGHLSRDCPDLGKKVMGQPVPYHPAWGRGRKGAKGGGAPQRPYKGRGKGKGAKGAAAKGKGWAHYTPVYDPYAWDWGDGQGEQHQLHFAQDAQPQGLAAFSQDDLRDEIRRRQAAALIQESIAAPAPPPPAP